MSKRNLDILKLFLESSPLKQHRQFMKIITVPQSHKSICAPVVSDEQYLSSYISNLEEVPTINHKYNFGQQNLRKVLGNQRIFRSNSSQPAKESQQLVQSIRNFSNSSESLIPYHELQQRIIIAEPETLNQIRSNLAHLFKVLLQKRSKLAPSSLELEANLQLSQTIIKALQKCSMKVQKGQEWRQLQAMEKLSKARQYKKKGFTEIAITSFQQVFKDEAAELRTRIQALRILCSEGEQHGDASILQPLVVVTHQKGEKQFQQSLLESIKKIKQGGNSKSN